MRVPPQVSDRIKEAPAQALRGVFAGIGQLLLITDKLRNKTSASQQVPRARAPEPSEATAPPAPPVTVAPPVAAAPAVTTAAPVTAATSVTSAPAAPEAAPVPEARDFDKTGNVRLLTSAETAAGSTAPAVDATVPATEAAEATEPAAVAEPAVEAAVAAETVAAETGLEAPLPNYDQLSVASLRARLRNLDVAQLRQLVDYEQAHADRADVIAMFTRRIAKLQAETTPEERGEAEGEADIEAQEDVEADIETEVDPEAEGEE